MACLRGPCAEALRAAPADRHQRPARGSVLDKRGGCWQCKGDNRLLPPKEEEGGSPRGGQNYLLVYNLSDTSAQKDLAQEAEDSSRDVVGLASKTWRLRSGAGNRLDPEAWYTVDYDGALWERFKRYEDFDRLAALIAAVLCARSPPNRPESQSPIQSPESLPTGRAGGRRGALPPASCRMERGTVQSPPRSAPAPAPARSKAGGPPGTPARRGRARPPPPCRMDRTAAGLRTPERAWQSVWPIAIPLTPGHQPAARRLHPSSRGGGPRCRGLSGPERGPAQAAQVCGTRALDLGVPWVLACP